ncbi:MAG: transporter substrate-binding domain-containing protein [Alphaproteobacteria bacterium]|nr:transporter substrate-binding domain-containing protein [Alphaproteobacteria bacterium]
MNFQKHIFKLFLLFVFFLIFQSDALAQPSGNEVNLTDEEKLWIEQHPVIRSTNEMEWAPLDFVRDGKALGFSIDYLNLVAEKVGLKIVYVNGLLWSELLGKLRNKEIDMAQSIIQSPEREEYLNFTVPYLDLPMVYFGRRGSKHISSFYDLQNKRIGVVIDSIPERVYKENFPDLNLVEFDSTLKALKALSAGTIDVHADILPASQYMIRTSLLPDIEVIGDKFFPETDNADYIRFAARKDWPILISILEKGMAAVSEQEFVALTDKWQTSKISGSLEDIGLTSEEQAWLSRNNVIRVAADPTVAPLEFIDNAGEITGVTGSYLRKIADKLNIRFETVPSLNWADSLTKIKDGQVDVIGLTTPTHERSEFLDFTDEYLVSTYMIFARKDERIIGNLDGLSGRKVAVVEGYAFIDYLKANYPDIDVIPVRSVADALNLVASQRADAHVGSLPMVAYNIAEQGYTNISLPVTPPILAQILLP